MTRVRRVSAAISTPSKLKGMDFLTIISGLPRSGTSMMMQALEAGGVPVLTDGVRRPDEDNPHGYYEFEPVKKTALDSGWVRRARGMAVKMVYRLVYEMPQDHSYRVIVMKRRMGEVLASQRIMLSRSNRTIANAPDEQLAKLFEEESKRFRQWLDTQEAFEWISVDYGQMVEAPVKQCRRVASFLGGGPDVRAMASVVDPLLYRNRCQGFVRRCEYTA